jgi:hypothetical protein
MAVSAYSQNVLVKQPKFSSVPNGISVAHTEKIMASVSSDNTVHAIRVHPDSTMYAAGIGHHFQQFRVKRFDLHYVPKGGTSTKGTVTLAPYYDADDPAGDVPTTSGVVDISTLPGATQFANWATGRAGWLARNASRAVFRNLGLMTVHGEGSSVQDMINDESKTPGWIIYQVSRSSDSQGEVGSLWCGYEFEFLDPIVAPGKMALSIESGSTSSSALALHTANFVGDPTSFKLKGNTITFRSPGWYTVIIVQDGTDPVIDDDGHLITDVSGTDVTADRLTKIYDTSAQTLSTPASSASQQAYAADSGTALQCLFLHVQMGDVLTIDALTGGTLTSTRVHIVRGTAPFALVP